MNGDWQIINPPGKKSDWVCRTILLNEDCPPCYEFEGREIPVYRPGKGDLVKITRRMNSRETALTGMPCTDWGEIRVLKIEFTCPVCSVRHFTYLPESWIEEGKAEFVEERQ